MRIWGVVARSIVLSCVLVTLGACQEVRERLGLTEDAAATDTGPEIEATEQTLDVGTSDAGQTPQDRRPRGKRKRTRKAAARRAKRPEAELDAALERAIVATADEAFRIDPFVLTLVADTLGRGEDALPFRRVTRAERKAGAPASFRVGPLPKGSLWRKLGLKPDDLVLSVEGVAPPGPKGLAKLRGRIPRDGTLTVKIQRGGVARELRYRIEPTLAWTRYLEAEAGRNFEAEAPPSSTRGSTSARPPTGREKTPSTKPASVPVSCSGSTCTVPKWYFDSIVGSSSKAKQQMKGRSVRSGFEVRFVGPASRKAGFAVGDVITKVNGRRTNNQLEMLALYGGLKSTKKFRVQYTRGSSKRTRTIVVEG